MAAILGTARNGIKECSDAVTHPFRIPISAGDLERGAYFLQSQVPHKVGRQDVARSVEFMVQ